MSNEAWPGVGRGSLKPEQVRGCMLSWGKGFVHADGHLCGQQFNVENALDT